ncbi:PREDICTED: geminin-like [Priapulus caudatus]|uniref:Geminin-like n=1 Tax=Priapulus caudatus TaxID=37621 RepID=A0ABM1DRN5_PRICU|nr:PREDICTED: geminin-like [Priapulus caudatus]
MNFHASQSQENAKITKFFSMKGVDERKRNTAALAERQDVAKPRRTLQTLQPAANSKTRLVGIQGTVDPTLVRKRKEKRKLHDDATCMSSPAKITKSEPAFMSGDDRIAAVNIYCDRIQRKSGGKTVKGVACQTEETGAAAKEKTPDEQAFELMCQEEVPLEYWKQLAEQRRDALEEALKENEELHEKNQAIGEELSGLNSENENLRIEYEQRIEELVTQADYFSTMIKTLANGESHTEGSLAVDCDTAEEADKLLGDQSEDCDEREDGANDLRNEENEEARRLLETDTESGYHSVA